MLNQEVSLKYYIWIKVFRDFHQLHRTNLKKTQEQGKNKEYNNICTN